MTDTVLLDEGRTVLVDNATGPVKLQIHGGIITDGDTDSNAARKLKAQYPGAGKHCNYLLKKKIFSWN